MLDRYWYGAVDRIISPETPVPVVRVALKNDASANVTGDSRAGRQASILSVVGEDRASHTLEGLVAETGITPYFATPISKLL
jgi:bifunctional ADP-heptose synthase (sugar kinase/adenylyltransferase)